MREKILVLEDGTNFLAEVVESLEDDSYTVVGCATPELALETAGKNSFDLFITDVRMAGYTDGIGVLGDVKRQCPSIYSIVMTGYTNMDSEVRAMQYGIDFFIHKPFRSTQYFLDAVAQVLATKSINATIQYQIKNFFRQIVGAKENQEPAYLERERMLLFKAYYTGIQSKKLSVSGGITLWDKLVGLEKRYEELGEFVGPAADQLAQDYRRLLNECEHLTKSFYSALIPKREKEQLSKELFQRLYDRIQEGKVSLPLSFRAPSLWNLSLLPSFRKEELGGLWNQLFAEDQIAQEAKQRFQDFMAKLNV